MKLENKKVLRRLVKGPATNTELERMSRKFSIRVMELREEEGIAIDEKDLGFGIIEYKLGIET